MTEVVIFPEMLQAGVEALAESKELTEEEKVVAVYLAMRAIYEIARMRAKASVH